MMKWLLLTIFSFFLLCAAVYEIQPAAKPFTTWTKVDILPRMCWGPNGNFGYGSNSLLDTFTNKWGNIIGRAFAQFDGDVDPLNGQFDWNTSLPGFQLDSTLANGILQRPNINEYHHLGRDSQVCVVLDLERLWDINGYAWFDSTGGAITYGADITFCDNLEELRSLMLEFEGDWGTPLPDDTLNASATRGWKYDTSFGTRSCQYVIIRYNIIPGLTTGVAFTSFVLYGEESPLGTRDIRITPAWDTPVERDTTFPISRYAGFVEAHPVPTPQVTWRTDTAFWWGGLGGYISAVTSTIGVFDKYNGSFVGPSNTNVKWDFHPYGGVIFSGDDTTYLKAKRNYQVDRAPNTYLLTQTSSGNVNIIGIDSSTADKRLRTSYQRWRLQFLRGAAKLCYEIPDTTNSVGQYLKYQFYANDPQPGRYARELFDYYIPYNENDIGFRTGSIPGSNYIPPVGLANFHDYLKEGWDSVFDVMPFVTMGFAAWDMEAFLEAEFILRVKYLGRTRNLGDIINIHPTISTWVRDVDGGCAGNGLSQGYLAGVRNEYRKMQSFIDTMAILSGVFRRAMVTEIAFESHTNFAIPDSTCTNGVSGLGVRQIGSGTTWYSQAVTINQANLYYYFTTLEALFGYEMMDASDTTSGFYNFADGAAGRVNGYQQYYKPAFFAEGQQHKFLNNYRGVLIQSDSTNGNFAGYLRHITSRDSFCLAVTWGSYTAAASPRTYLLWTDVTAATKKTHIYGTDWTFNGNSAAATVTSNTVTETPTPEISYYFFSSSELARLLDNPPHYFRVNRSVQFIQP